jgi:hypothetical protein
MRPYVVLVPLYITQQPFINYKPYFKTVLKEVVRVVTRKKFKHVLREISILPGGTDYLKAMERFNNYCLYHQNNYDHIKYG